MSVCVRTLCRRLVSNQRQQQSSWKSLVSSWWPKTQQRRLASTTVEDSGVAKLPPVSAPPAPQPPKEPPLPKQLHSKVFADAATVQKLRALKKSNKDPKTPKYLMFTVGAPFVLFSILAAWVVSNALDGKLKELEASKGMETKSLRQAALQTEHEEMMERLNKIVAKDFDNTKRIKRPHEVLEERRLEREKRNAWHRRLYRSIFGESTQREKE